MKPPFEVLQTSSHQGLTCHATLAESLLQRCDLCQRTALKREPRGSGNLFATLQTEASRIALKLPEDPKKRKTVQLMEVTEKLWKSRKHQNKAPVAMKKLPNALKAIVATNGDPTGR